MSTLTPAQAALRPELVYPDYHIYQLRPDYYKIVRFESTAPRCGRVIQRCSDGFRHDDKLPAAISRARRVCLELALTNDWKWFCTFTIAQNNFDRKNLDGFYKRFREWFKYQGEKLGKKLPYLLVPEQHGDGSWHMHGFLTADIDPFLVSFEDQYEAGADVPLKLVRGGYYNWPAYQKRFGFCSLGLIRDPIACAHYVTKYISKSFLGDSRKVGLDLYFCSQGLNRAQLQGEIYGRSAEFDSMLHSKFEWCATGFVRTGTSFGDYDMRDLIDDHGACLAPLDLDELCRMFHPEALPDHDLNADSFYQDCIAGM